MVEINKILDSLEASLERSLIKLIISKVNESPKETYYSFAFWNFSFDYLSFSTPCFALNTIEYLKENSDSSQIKWSPKNWKYPNLDFVTGELSAAYEELNGYLKEKPENVWNIAINAVEQIYCCMCENLTTWINEKDEPFQKLKLPSNFVIAILEIDSGTEEYLRLLEESVNPEYLNHLEGIHPNWSNKKEKKKVSINEKNLNLVDLAKIIDYYKAMANSGEKFQQLLHFSEKVLDIIENNQFNEENIINIEKLKPDNIPKHLDVFYKFILSNKP